MKIEDLKLRKYQENYQKFIEKLTEKNNNQQIDGDVGTIYRSGDLIPHQTVVSRTRNPVDGPVHVAP